MAEAISVSEAPLTVDVVEGRDAFVQLEKAWNDALAKGPRNEPMLRHEWIRAWIENFAPGATLRTFVARTGKEIHAALPLVESVDRDMDTCYIPLTTWSAPVNDHSQRGGLLLGRMALEGMLAIWEKIAATPGWDRLRLRDLPYGALEWQLRDKAFHAGFPTGTWESLSSPYLPLPAIAEKPAPASKKQKVQKLPTTDARYEQVEANLDAKFRQNLRRRRRRLAEKGKLEYRLVDNKDAKALDKALADFFDIEASGWKGEGGTAIALKPELVGYYTQLARDAAKRNALALGLLELDGKVIAAHFSMVHAGRHFLIKIGYDESLHVHSPGQQMVSDAIKDSCVRGLEEFDFLGPNMPWKLDWESKLRPHAWLTIFNRNRKAKLVYAARVVAWPIAKAFMPKRGGGN
jgi:CelD/BcsL family acetyltransferase involved in cellulose biosynthesis